MDPIERILKKAGPLVVAVGCAMALACAFVIVTSDDLLAPAVVSADAAVIRLDPIVVTISAEHFDAIYAEAESGSLFVSEGRRQQGEG